MVKKYELDKTKYGDELLVDLVPVEMIEPYLRDITHSLAFYEIMLISKGTGVAFIDDKTYPIQKNAVFFLSPGQVRKWEINKMPGGYSLIFEEEFLLSFFNDPAFVEYLPYFNAEVGSILMASKEEYKELMNYMENIKYEISLKERDAHMLRALLYQMLIFLKRKYAERHPGTEKKKMNRYIYRFVQLVNNDFKEQHSVRYYAHKLNITSSHLNDMVKRDIGIPAKKYIQNKIMLEAKRLLSYTNLSVAEIAAELYFEDVSYFVRFFRMNVQMTPLHFRKNNP